MSFRSATLLGAICVLMGTATPVRADIFRCKRADGTLHYTNIREPGKRCQLVVRSSKKGKPKSSGKSKGKSAATKQSAASTKDPARYRRYDGLIDEAARL
jgi:hypothetical protein